MSKYKDLSKSIIEKVGGVENVQVCSHCATRLRFNLKDLSIIELDEIGKLSGVLGTKITGDQLQIIIGPDVEEVYQTVCDLGGFASKKSLGITQEEKKQEKKTAGGLFNSLVATISGCIEPMFVVFTLGGFFRLFAVILGPTMLGFIGEESHLFILFTMVGDTCFTYFPVYVAYTSAKKFGANIPMALILACILINPTLTEMAEAGSSFSVYGIPVIPTTYLNSFLPTLLITFALSKVELLFKNRFPIAIKPIMYPLCTMLVMLPLALVFLGPIGNVIGIGLASIILWLQEVFGPLATALVGALFPLLIVTGMHHALNSAALVEYLKKGYDSCIWAGSYIMDFQLLALCFASLIKSKKQENKAIALSCIATEGIGGVSEPTIFGIMLKSKRNILYVMAGGFIGGFYIGLMNVNVYVFAPAGFLSVFAYSGGTPENLMHGAIACALAFVVPFILALVFGMGLEEKEVENI